MLVLLLQIETFLQDEGHKQQREPAVQTLKDEELFVLDKVRLPGRLIQRSDLGLLQHYALHLTAAALAAACKHQRKHQHQHPHQQCSVKLPVLQSNELPVPASMSCQPAVPVLGNGSSRSARNTLNHHLPLLSL